MKINKRYSISILVFVVAIVVSILSTYKVKSNADEETLAQVKQQLQEQINMKSQELEEKDKQLEDLNNKVTEQSATIDQLNETVNNLSNSVNNTQIDLNNTKEVQKADKKEITAHADDGDANLQKQIDEVKKTPNDGFVRDGDIIEPDSKDFNKKEKEDN